MTAPRRRIRSSFLVVAVLVALAVAAGVAVARADARSIGTGVVVIETELAYQNGEAAGTGMVLTSSGEVLTNNHVISGATTITVVVPGTDRHYSARVVGYSLARDVAVLQLRGASNLQTVSTGSSSRLIIGQSVTAVGNAGGSGRLSSATGTITGLGKTITAHDDQGRSERLTGLIETNASVEPGDSGGPLLDRAGRVIGMTTAASTSGFGFETTSADASYAIRIGNALGVARQVEAGRSSATVHVGGTAFLGIQIEPATSGFGDSATSIGALIDGVVPNGPSARAGLVPGDVITAIAGRAAKSPQQLMTTLLAQKPGMKVAVAFIDRAGSRHTVRVTLGSGPPQ